MPVPRTATVRPPAASAARWAAASTPAARPLTTVTPAWANPRPSSSARRRLYSLARRAPTMAIAGSPAPPSRPRTASTRGGCAMWRSAGGYARSLQATSVAPAAVSFRASARARPAAVRSDATAAGGRPAAANASPGASSTARGVAKLSTSVKVRRGSNSGTSASPSQASAASSRTSACVRSAMRKRSGYYTCRAVATRLAALHGRTERAPDARSVRSGTRGGRRIAGRQVLLAGDELAAAEAHAVALRADGEEDRDRIGVGGERVPEPGTLADCPGDLPLLHDHGLDGPRRVREAVALDGASLADRLPASRREQVWRVETVARGGEDAQAAAELRGVTGHDRGVLRDQHEDLLRRLARVRLQQELRARDGLPRAGRERGGSDRAGGRDRRGGGRRADAVARRRPREEGEVRTVVAVVGGALQAHGAVPGSEQGCRRVTRLPRSRVAAVGDAVDVVVGHARIPRGRILGRRQAPGRPSADHAAGVAEGGRRREGEVRGDARGRRPARRTHRPAAIRVRRAHVVRDLEQDGVAAAVAAERRQTGVRHAALPAEQHPDLDVLRGGIAAHARHDLVDVGEVEDGVPGPGHEHEHGEQRDEHDGDPRHDRSPLAAEHEVVARLLAAAVRGADEHVAGDAAHVVDHAAVDEARQSAVVGLHLGPAGRVLGRDLAVIDGAAAAALLVHHEVARAGEPGERLVVVAPELVAPARRTAEALLEEREGGERVLAVEDH